MSSVCYASSVSASADRALSQDINAGAYITVRPQQGDSHNKGMHYITIHSHDDSKYPVKNELWPCYSLKTDITSYECEVCISYMSAL